MKRLVAMSFFIILIVLAVSFFAYQKFFGESIAQVFSAQPATIESVVDDVLAHRADTILRDGEVDFGEKNEINVLLLGLDARKGSLEPHCDAIHMYTLDIENWNMRITSVPRGTYSYIPPGTYEETEYYLANACAFAGLDYGVEQIEKIVGVKADYVATVGFSQTLGILRFFELPTTESLQWLRHRQSYAIGDPQRSHNQAVFMKDLIISQLNKFRSGIGLPAQYILYGIVDTDMDFSVARALLNGFVDAKIDQRADDITLAMRPHYVTQDLHFDTENPDEQINELLSFIRPYLSNEDLSDRTLDSVQDELVEYLQDRLDSEATYSDVVNQQLWLQVENIETREEFHYLFIEGYAQELVRQDVEEVIDLLSSYIFEKETVGEYDYANQGRELMSDLILVEV
jgi:hypothetical protein